MARIYTRTGDDGTTGLGSGERVSKSSLRIDAYGCVDELNSHLGRARADGLVGELETLVAEVQESLFVLGAELAAARRRGGGEEARLEIEEPSVRALEAAIDRLEAELEPLKHFILPAGSSGATQLHVARTVCRRAERAVVRLDAEEAVRSEAVRYLNRLSDLLFVMARYENARRGVEDVVWSPGPPRRRT